MPARSIIDQMPAEARDWLKAKLEETNFSRFVEITDEFNTWAEEHGIEVRVSKTGLFRFAKNWKEKVEVLREVTHFARSVRGQLGDDEGAVNDVGLQLLQGKIFQLAVEEEIDPKTLSSLARAMADLSRASVMQKRWGTEYRDKMQQKLSALETDASAGKTKLDPETLKEVRRQLFGEE
jgi:hypothetical protein